MVDPRDIIAALELAPHIEGGYLKRTYESSDWLTGSDLPSRYDGSRMLATAAYYFHVAGTQSYIHRLNTDEIHHFYLGDPVEFLLLYEDGSYETKILGPNILEGHHVQMVTRVGMWFGSSLVPGGSWALLGDTLAPGFDYRDFELGDRDELVSKYPAARDRIMQLTPDSVEGRLDEFPDIVTASRPATRPDSSGRDDR